MDVHKRCWARQGVIEQKLVVAIARAEAAEKQLAEAQEHLDHARIAGIYDIFTSIPDAVYQMARYIKEQERKLVDAQARIVHLEQLADEALTVATMCNDAAKEHDES